MITTPKPSNVRIAGPADEDQLYNVLSEELFQENGTFSLSERKGRGFIHDTVNRLNYGIIGIIEEGGVIAGCIGMNLGTFWYSDDWHVEEYWNLVRLPYRKHIGNDSHRSFYAKDLINFAKWYADYMNLILNIGIISTQRTEAKCRLYSRVLQPTGQFFMHNLHLAKGPGIQKLTVEFK